VDFKVTEADLGFRRAAKALRRTRADVETSVQKVKLATPKAALMPPKYHAAKWKKEQALKKRHETHKLLKQ
jgi:hypothetical protein